MTYRLFSAASPTSSLHRHLLLLLMPAIPRLRKLSPESGTISWRSAEASRARSPFSPRTKPSPESRRSLLNCCSSSVFNSVLMNAMKNSSLQMAAIEQQKADENVLKLAGDQKKQKEQLHAKIIQLEKQLDMKQKLELEIQQLKGSLNVLKHIKDGEDAEIRV
ncbi:factor of DNA methylation 4-like isoform X1 [Gastrolobium bilobum]|uniref:factor of DNA methylation 4-like isoform X1 n=1 Tax=Gastrolobium bilobum TaxID=150636 RepID=UPI002AB0EAC4|nr:factor of DNA methylation 4-like isoform X1 [Gastrolobium bilobum]